MTPLVLSVFPGIGLLDMAFEERGFCVVRGPDLLWGGDIRKFHPPAGRFDGVIGGPPCQAFSRLRHVVEHNGYKVAENLIPEFCRVVAEAQPEWFLMENVPAAPLPVVTNFYIRAYRLNAREHCGSEQNRERLFSFGTRDGRQLPLGWWAPPVPMKYEPAVLASGGERMTPVKIGGSGKSKAAVLGYKTRTYAAAAAAQGVPGLELPAFTIAAKIKAIGNGVPLPMGRAVADAVWRAIHGDALPAEQSGGSR